jgi:tyrocidine synthetase-3
VPVKRFEEQAEKRAGKIAVKTPEASITYDELNRYANRTARLLEENCSRQGKHGKNRIIGLLFNHGIDMIAAVLGTLKAGKSYVPLSPDYPRKRLSHTAAHAEVSLILTDSANMAAAGELAPEKNTAVLNIEESKSPVPGTDKNPARKTRDKDLMYILYTSGSTGHPKGVMQGQRSVLHFIDRYSENLSITAEDRISLLSSFTHDASIMDIYGALLNGAALYPLDIMKLTDLSFLSQWLINERITIWHSVPTIYRYFVRTLTGEENYPLLRYIVLGGEPVLTYDVDMFRRRFPHTTLYNLYGQTESTYNSGMFITREKPVDEITLGEVVSGTEIFVVDEDGNEVDALETGEIVVGGPHVSPGYWKDEEATARSFRVSPEFGRLYRTGDFGCPLLDGSIEFIGRKDSQVKIRGCRVELGEIESVLLKHGGVSEAAVIAVEGGDGAAAYIVGRGAPAPGTAELRDYLSQELPDYMIPSYFVFMERLPLTPSGKIDRNALPKPGAKTGGRYTAPRTGIETKLAEVWGGVLGIEKEKIGIDDNFFELGGHSLKATVLTARIHRVLNVRIPLTRVFRTNTIRGLSQYIKEAEEEKYAAVEPVEKKAFYPLSSAQKRLFVLQRMEPGHTGYHILWTALLEGVLDIDRLQTAFQRLIRRHESLRTSFRMIDHQPVQVIHRDVAFKIENYTMRGSAPIGVEMIIRDFIRPFNLSRAPLLRAGLIKQEQEKHVLAVDTHHIISDGTSHAVLMQEFAALYQGVGLAPLRIQYKDYSQWQNNTGAREAVAPQKDYWLNEFKGKVPVLNLPVDYERQGGWNFAGQRLSFEIGERETKILRDIAGAADATLFMVLLSIFNIFLARVCGREEVVAGTPTTGRRHPDLEYVIGMFVNTLVLKNSCPGEKIFKEFLLEVKERTLAAFENQDYPFEELVDEVLAEREPGRNPLFDVMFILQNIEVRARERIAARLPGLQVKQYDYKRKQSVFDMTFIGYETREGLRFSLEYNTHLFRQEKIERFIRYFKEIVSAVIENQAVKLEDIIISHDLAVTGKQLFHEERGDFAF